MPVWFYPIAAGSLLTALAGGMVVLLNMWASQKKLTEETIPELKKEFQAALTRIDSHDAKINQHEVENARKFQMIENINENIASIKNDIQYLTRLAKGSNP